MSLRVIRQGISREEVEWTAGSPAERFGRVFFRLRAGVAFVLLVLTLAGTSAVWKVVTDRSRGYVQRRAAETLAVQA